MQQFEWRDLGQVDYNELGQTKNQVHQAIQLVAAVGRKFREVSPNDDNATLSWIPGLTRLAGKWVQGNKTFRTSLGLIDFCIYIVDEKVNTISKFSLNGKNQTQVLLWMEEQIGKLDLDASDLTLHLPYSIPSYGTQDGEPFLVDLKMSNELSKYYHNTFICLRDLYKKTEGDNPDINIWPHHFDEAMTIIVKDTGDDETNSTVMLGMSPGDNEFNRPYFYVNTWPHVDTSKLGSSPTGAFWHEQLWTGTVLPVEEVLAAENQKSMIDTFYERASHVLIQALKS
ncbi:MAG: hypothetical protein ACJA08_001782 [Cyclobacteriaceae bacterium]|jgi:hypothetical protein